MTLNVSVALVFLLVSSLAAKDRDWQSGMLMDSQSTRERVPGDAITSGTVTPDGEVSLTTRLSHWNITETELVIQGKNYAYVVEKQTSRTWDGKPGLVLASAVASARQHSCRFVIGDAVRFAQSKNKLYAIDADGKECKFEITRQERIQP